MSSIIRFSWIFLILGLLAPLDLPAGGISSNNSIIPLREDFKRKYAGTNCNLRTSPLLNSSDFISLPLGTPLRVIRTWESSDKQQWMLVDVDYIQFMNPSNAIHRGWINV